MGGTVRPVSKYESVSKQWMSVVRTLEFSHNKHINDSINSTLVVLSLDLRQIKLYLYSLSFASTHYVD